MLLGVISCSGSATRRSRQDYSRHAPRSGLSIVLASARVAADEACIVSARRFIEGACPNVVVVPCRSNEHDPANQDSCTSFNDNGTRARWCEDLRE